MIQLFTNEQIPKGELKKSLCVIAGTPKDFCFLSEIMKDHLQKSKQAVKNIIDVFKNKASGTDNGLSPVLLTLEQAQFLATKVEDYAKKHSKSKKAAQIKDLMDLWSIW
jgi:hypothetical protein